jgi:hypothetical protein
LRGREIETGKGAGGLKIFRLVPPSPPSERVAGVFAGQRGRAEVVPDIKEAEQQRTEGDEMLLSQPYQSGGKLQCGRTLRSAGHIEARCVLRDNSPTFGLRGDCQQPTWGLASVREVTARLRWHSCSSDKASAAAARSTLRKHVGRSCGTPSSGTNVGPAWTSTCGGSSTTGWQARQRRQSFPANRAQSVL